jgi:hypothetical protein
MPKASGRQRGIQDYAQMQNGGGVETKVSHTRLRARRCHGYLYGCLHVGPYGGPWWGAVSYERATPEQPANKVRK